MAGSASLISGCRMAVEADVVERVLHATVEMDVGEKER